MIFVNRKVMLPKMNKHLGETPITSGQIHWLVAAYNNNPLCKVEGIVGNKTD